ncbi:uncharacterized protein LOC118202525 [Stegodyphus dumicola]|uniref:uncharacterized protein LOC118202525 n=1 Tax=Stegodyphus dumicola TaxID=202533 RepID=UPI0015B05427|nr:uncharacterized protein LOC118202525 [Stegodyphus dumicola]
MCKVYIFLITWIICSSKIKYYAEGYTEYDLWALQNASTDKIQIAGKGLNSTGLLSFSPPPFVANCTVKLMRPEGHHIVLSIERLTVHSTCQNYLKFISQSKEKTFCKAVDKTDFEFNTLIFYNEMVTVSFVLSVAQLLPPYLKIVFTVVHNEPCGNDAFKCTNRFCVWKDLKCDSYNNCGDFSDEIRPNSSIACYITEKNQTTGGDTSISNFKSRIILYTSIALFVTFMFLVIVYIMKKW